MAAEQPERSRLMRMLDRISEWEWIQLIKELLWTRLFEPAVSYTALLGYFGLLIIASGFGLWLTVAHWKIYGTDGNDLLFAALTYVFAMVSTNALAILVETMTIPIRVFLSVFSVLSLSPFIKPSYHQVRFLVGKELAPSFGWGDLAWWLAPCLLVWWITNATNPQFATKVKGNDPAGGNPLRDIR